MRPRRIEVEGFSSFRSSTVIELDDVDLVAFVGPTGAGKSTVIDAMTFALYGRVARYDDARLVAPAIHQAVNEAKVRLDFELAGERYVAVRVVRRTKTGATTKEARLERHRRESSEGDEDALDGSQVLASGAKEVSEAVEALLGLDFAQFTRTVVLPQGEFAEFLRDDPASRQRLLRRLLDLEMFSAMGSAAREEAKLATQRVDLIDQQLARAGDVTPDRLVAAKDRLVTLEGFAAEAGGVIDQLADLDLALADLRGEVTTIDEAMDRLAQLAVPNELADGTDDLEAARAAHRSATAELADRRARRDAARGAADAAGDPTELRNRLTAAHRSADLESEVARLVEDQAGNEAALEKANGRVEDARGVLAALNDALTAARRSADAAGWRADLRVGELCPVCRTKVESIPDHDPSVEFTAAQDSVREADAAVAEATSAAAGAVAAVEGGQVRLEERRREQALVAETSGRQPIDELERHLQQAVEAGQEVDALTAQALDAERELDAAATRVTVVEGLERAQRLAFNSQRDSVADLEPPAPAGERLAVDWLALLEWAEASRSELAKRRVDVAAAGKEAAAAKAALAEQLRSGAESLGLPSSPDELASALVRANAEATAEIATLAQRLDQLAEWRTERAKDQEAATVSDELGRLLSASGFERWLLAEALEDLVVRATDRLLELSGGQYSLAVDETVFTIIDHRNADDHRDVRTLSGGETFLASLALALALSDSISELAPVDSPRLGSMFLDEGFGTLDPETLDVVASAIEELSASGRLVGIVTHIDALAERMPVRFVVSKGPTSSSVERVVA